MATNTSGEKEQKLSDCHVADKKEVLGTRAGTGQGASIRLGGKSEKAG